jgi:diguanylate cyclase (GGDEF)-like protein
VARLKKRRAAQTHRIAIVDDDKDLANAHAALLRVEGHQVVVATSARAGVDAIRGHKPDLVLLDYYMADFTAADVVREVREFDEHVQVSLVTWYAGEQPARRLLAELDIQGCHDKFDGPARLLVLVDAALKHRRALDRIVRQRRYLEALLDHESDITKVQREDEFFRTGIAKLAELVGRESGVLTTANSEIFVFDSEEQSVALRVGTGRYQETAGLDELSNALRNAVSIGVTKFYRPCVVDGLLIVPLRPRGGDAGCMVVDCARLPRDAADACFLLARQIVQTLENASLSELATTDPMTRVANRRCGDDRLDESFLLGARSGSPTSFILIDLDHFKAVNEKWGHAAGDIAVARIARVIGKSCQAGDLVCRFGGEEFLLVLPSTGAVDALRRAEAIRDRVSSATIPLERKWIDVTVSAGVATAPHDGEAREALLRKADAALYQAEERGRYRAVCAA